MKRDGEEEKNDGGNEKEVKVLTDSKRNAEEREGGENLKEKEIVARVHDDSGNILNLKNT